MEEIDLKEILDMVWRRKIEIAFITFAFMIIGIVYSFCFITPEYKAATSLVLVQNTSNIAQIGTTTTAITTTDLTMNSKLVSTYSELIKRDAVLGKVAQNLGITDAEATALKRKISVNAVEDTEIIEITVQNENPEYAAKVANEIADVFSEKIVEIYNLSNVYILDQAKAPVVPSNINHLKDIVIFIFIGIVASCGYVFVLNLLDDSIKSEEDIEKSLGLTLLCSIPTYDVELKVYKGGNK